MNHEGESPFGSEFLNLTGFVINERNYYYNPS